jgi:membrane-associated phospholipid phosphatase
VWNSDPLMSDMRIAPGPSPVGAGGGASPDRSAARSGRPTWRRPDVVGPAVLLAIFLALLALVLARPTALTHADSWVRDRVQSVSKSEHFGDDGRPNWPLLQRIADLGGTLPALPVLAVATFAATVLRRSWRPLAAAGFAYAVLGGAVLTLKANVKRPGPGQTTMIHGGLGFFPSGHTANTVMCYGTCALLLAGGTTGALVGKRARTALAVAFAVLVLAITFCLVWLDYHWVSDVLGSYALCGAALFGVAAILGFHAPGPHRVDQPPSDPEEP